MKKLLIILLTCTFIDNYAQEQKKYLTDSTQSSSGNNLRLLSPTQTETVCGSWSTVANYPTNIAGSGVVALGSNIYSFTGYNGVYTAASYKFNGTSWSAIANTPDIRYQPVVVTDGTYIYIVAGSDESNTVQNTIYRYNPSTNTYSTMAPIPTAVGLPSGVVFNNKIYIFGGCTTAACNTFIGSTQIYDIATNTWSLGPNYPFGVSNMGAVVIGGYIYLGSSSQNDIKTYRFDGTTFSDASISDLGANRSVYSSVNYNDNFVLLGGVTSDVVTNTAVSWEPSTNTWTSLPNMPTAVSKTVRGAAVLGSSIYVIGGSLDGGFTNLTNTVQKFSTTTCTPEIDVKGNNISIVDGDATPSTTDATDFGSASIGGSVVKTYTILNTGNGNLTLSGNPRVSIGGTNAADFSVTTQPSISVIPPSGTTTFQVTFTPSASGTRSASISITNDDSNENPYNFLIQGTVACNITMVVGTATNPTTCTGANGTIPFTSTNLPNGTYSLSFTATGAGATTSPQSVTVSGNTFTLAGLKAGAYSNFSVISNGCTGSVATSRTLTEPASPTLTVGTATNPSTCAGTNGSIAFTSTNLSNGTYSLTFTATGAGANTSPQSVTVSGNTFTLAGLKAGTYSNFSVTTSGCTGSVATSRTLTDPASPTLTVGTATNPSTCAGTNGSIAITSTNLANGTYSLTFTATGAGATTSPQSVTVSGNTFTLSGLKSGAYSSFSVTNTGCTGVASTSRTLTDPATPTLTAGTVTNPTTCGGTGSIAFTSTNLPNGTYSLSYTGTGLPKSITVSGNAFSLTGLPAGSYNNFSVTNAGCTGTASTSRTLTDPATPTLTAGTVTNPTTCGGTGSIAFTSTNLPNGTYSLTYTGAGSPKTITVSGNTFSLTGLLAGNYSNFSVTNAGCTGSVATSKTVADPATPTLTAGVVTNPTTCGGTGSIAFTSTNLPNGTYTLNYTLNGSATSKSITVASNAFSLTALLTGSYNTFSITNAGCTGSTGTLNPAKILTNPPSPTLTVGAITQPTTCGGTGSIAFTSTNLPNGTYTLNYTFNGTATSKSITVSTNAFSLTGITVGVYNNFATTNNGCTSNTVTTSRTLTSPTIATPTGVSASSTLLCGEQSVSLSANCGVNTVTWYNQATGGTALGTGSPFLQSPKITTTFFAACNNGNCESNRIATSQVVVNRGIGGNNVPYTDDSSVQPNFLFYNKYTTSSAMTVDSVSVLVNNGPDGSLIGNARIKIAIYSDDAGNPQTLLASSDANANTATPFLVKGLNRFKLNSAVNLPCGTYWIAYVLSSAEKIAANYNNGEPVPISDTKYSSFAFGGAFPTTNNLTKSPNGFAYNVYFSGYLDCALPTPSNVLPTTTAICSGSSITLSGTCTTGTITWYTVSSGGISIGSGTNLIVNPTNSTTYYAACKNGGCEGGRIATGLITVNPIPTISAGTVVNPATCGSTGSIPFTATNLPNGTYSLSFTATGAGATTSPRNVTVNNNTFSLTGLSVGSYSNFSLISAGCTGTDATSKTIANPTTPTLAAGTAVNPTSCGGTDGSIPFTTNLPDGTYSLSYTGTGSPKSITVSGGVFTLGSLGSGAYSNFSVTNNGCVGTASTSKSLNDPAAPVLTLGTTTNPSACNLADGSIAFTTSNIAEGTYSLTYSSIGTSATAGPKSVMVSANTFILNGLADGVYSNFSITNGSGCTGSLGSSVTLIDLALPALTVGASTNPTTCTGTQGTIAFTTANLPDGTYSLSFSSTGTASPQNIAVASNAFTLSGLTAGTYSNFSVTRLGCTGSVSTSKTLVDPVAPTLTVGMSLNPTICAGTDGSIAFTTTNLANGTYSLSFTSTGTVSPKNVVVTNNTFTLSGLIAGNYSNFSLINNGCTATVATAKTLSDPASISLLVGTSTNPSTCSGTDGSINFTTTNLTNGSYTLTYTGAGSPKTVTVNSNAFSINGLSAGAYSNFSITYLGCIGSDSQTKTLSDPASATLTAGTVTNPSTCNGSNGSIAFTSTNLPNGNYSLSYTGTGSPQTVTVSNNAFTLTGLSAGNYSNFSLVSNGCTSIEPTAKSLVAPSTPTLTAGNVTNPSTCSGTDGSIAFATNLPNGIYSFAFTGANSPQNITVTSGAFILSGLSTGVYSNFSIISNGCTATDETSKTLADPTTPTLTAGIVTNPSTCNGTNGSIAFTTSLVNGTYSLVYTGAGSPRNITVTSGSFTLTGLQDGVYANFSITSNGCVSLAATSKTLVDPATPTLNAGTATNPSICSGTDGKIAFTTSLPNGNYSLNFSGGGSPKNITVANGAFELTGLSSGSYSGFSVITNGCTGTDATAITLTAPAAPTLTAGAGTNPSTCSSSDGKIAFTTTLPNGTYTLNYTGTGSPKNVTVVSGAFELTGLPDGTFSGFSITVNGCTGTDATVKTLTDPAAPTLTAGTTTNPSTCSSADGSITFTTSLPNGTYTLNYTGTGSPKSITVANGTFTLTGLPDGTFSGFSVTTGGCTGVSSTSITLTDPTAPTITAGTITNPSSCNGTDGSIAFTTTLSNGNYTLNYTGSGSPKTITVVSGVFTLSGLPSGNYSGFSITNGGCVGIDNNTKSLVNPNLPTLTVGTATNPSTCSGTGSIAFTTSLPNGTYNLTFTGAGSPKLVTVTNGAFTLSDLLAGTYSDFSIDNGNGCVGTDATSKTLSEPNAPTIAAGTVTNPSTCSGNDGSIAFATNLPNGTYSLNFTGTGSPKNVIVLNGAFSLTGLSAGTYSNFSVTNNGCTGSDATTKSLNDPLAPSALISGNDNLNCSITSVMRTASGGATYLWSNGLGTNASVSISMSGTYTVTVTLNGCTATATTSVTFTNDLVATASNSGPYRVGNTIELNASGGSNYTWSGPNNFVSTGQNPNISNALVANAGVYTVTVSTGGCSATATTNVVIDAFLDPCIPIIDYQFVKAGNPYQPLFSLTNGMTINQLAEGVSIIAVPICPSISIESVNMVIQGPSADLTIIQSVSPYAIFDNFGTNVYGRVLAPGVYTLTVTGYTQDNLQGSINYGPVTTTFTILPNAAIINAPTVSRTSLCIGSNVDVTFSTTGVFNPNNQFKVELSDINGNFGSTAIIGNTSSNSSFVYPTIIGTTNVAGTISCTIPNTEGSTNYRIRIVSTDGVSVSPAAPNALTIHPKDLNFVSPINDFSANAGIKQASQKIIASNKVIVAANVSYQAGKAIILNAGFEANAGTVFKAEIKGCEN